MDSPLDSPGDAPRDPSVREELLVLCLEALEAGGTAALDELLARYPAHADEVREQLEALQRTGLLAHSAEVPERLGDFRIREKLGEGGMGVVYRAEQVSLGREVALKLVRPEGLWFGDSRARFQREVEAIASLHHPGIVAIYTVGEEAGVPYFAMELVDGLCVDAVLGKLRGRALEDLRGADLDPAGDGSSYLFQGTWEEACLRVVRQVCDALQFAHGRGVLHRDIKPSNIMLAGGAAARAQLLDFGLARTSRSDKLTATGSQLGSLRYMAPEQLRGELDDQGPATDVYGLGVTLFEMLTLSPAFSGGQTEVTLAVTRDGMPSVRSRNRRASWEVDTIVAKATDPDAHRRYASAADMAHDLANALERRPIEARRAGPWLRFRRWAQRHPAGATSLALGAVVALAAPSAYAWQQRRAAREIRAERDAAVRAFRSALEAVDRMLARIGGEELAYVPGMEAVREGLLQDAIDLLEGVVQEEGLYVGREGRYELVSARQRLGRLFGLLGRTRESVDQYAEGRRLLDELLAEDPDDLRAGELFVSGTTEEAGMRQEAGELEAGLALHEELGRWLSARAGVAELAPAAARNRAERAHALELLGRLDEARADFAAACPVLDGFAEASGALDDVLAAATAWSHYGDVWLNSDPTGIDEAGVRAIERSLALFRRAVALDPTPQNAMMMCASMTNTAGAYRRTDRVPEADAMLEEAQSTLARLVDEHPDTLTLQLELAAVENQIGFLRTSDGWGAALPYFQRGSRLLAHVATTAPDVAFFQRRYATIQYNLVSAMQETGAPQADLEREVRAGVAASERGFALAPEVDAYRIDVLDLHALWFDVVRPLGDAARAAEVAESLVRALPADPAAAQRAAEQLAQACALVRADATLAPEARDEALGSYATRACDLLQRALRAGVSLPTPREHPPLAPLRGTPAFEALCEWVEQRSED